MFVKLVFFMYKQIMGVKVNHYCDLGFFACKVQLIQIVPSLFLLLDLWNPCHQEKENEEEVEACAFYI